MSPLLQRPQSPPVVTNHVGGKGPPAAPGSPSYLSLKGVPANQGIFIPTYCSKWSQKKTPLAGFGEEKEDVSLLRSHDIALGIQNMVTSQ
ncbi:hypothetical protein HGM15179_021189 [Zosterops borbonicus]|uniref:Uncharacterized protein n=1 Tax=Zosterops borbonicus TaxID=364589 RepID=A0A8K1FTG6_9PASS|nr:hypothetical protein HGM15179_021189 [Zosterops borbonicus]